LSNVSDEGEITLIADTSDKWQALSMGQIDFARKIRSTLMAIIDEKKPHIVGTLVAVAGTLMCDGFRTVELSAQRYLRTTAKRID
jgi:hypothetical protein